MIAAVDHSTRAVWGIGRSPGEAMQDALREIAGKPLFADAAKRLELAALRPGAPIESDGETLYPYCVPDTAPQQAELF